MESRNLLQEFKFQLFSGTMTNRLVIINVLVFLIVLVFDTFIRLFNIDLLLVENLKNQLFTLDSDLIGFLHKPWGIFTSIFSHFDFWHLLLNMLFLYFSGTYFEQLFGKRKMLLTYIFGGILGGIFEISAKLIFPFINENAQLIIGASGSIMALFTALAFHSPNTKVHLFGIIPIKIYFIALFFLIQDFIGIGSNDNTAHFAHLGGAAFGILSVRNIQSNKNILNRLQNALDKFISTFNKKRKNTESSRIKTDEEYNYERKLKQEKTDIILDKIAKSGYESLSKAEKDFLFNQSKNG